MFFETLFEVKKKHNIIRNIRKYMQQPRIKSGLLNF